MKKKIIHIDREKCIGCGACAETCHQGAIAMIAGKAMLVKEDHCDGLGRCLPKCPADAISFIEKEIIGCPGNKAKAIKREEQVLDGVSVSSKLMQWPCQIKLVPINAPYFNEADLLVAADCTAFAYGNFHNDFMKDKVTVVGCPKLDDIDYSEKLGEILANNDIKSITVTRMEVPCCGGIERAVQNAIKNSGKTIPLNVVTISTAGDIL